MLSLSLLHAGDLLNVVSSSTLGLHLQNKEFQCAVQYWLGTPYTTARTPAISIVGLLTYLGITRLAVVGAVTGPLTITPSEVWFLLQLNQFPSHFPKKSPDW